MRPFKRYANLCFVAVMMFVVLGCSGRISLKSSDADAVVEQPACGAAAKPHYQGAELSVIGPAWGRTNVNATPFRSHAITTHGNSQYVAYYDPLKRMTLAYRNVDIDGNLWSVDVTPYTGNTRDAHNGISIAIDGSGVLHASWDHHGHPLRYARATVAGWMQLSEKLPMIGRQEQHVTYPQFLNLPDGRLLFMYRDGGSGNGNMVINRYDPATQEWVRLHDVLIDGEGQRNAYWQAAVDPLGKVHVSWVWRESGNVATNHDLAYAVSDDAGETWKRSDGSLYELPINAQNAEYACLIPQAHELINQTSMAGDARGRPYIASYWREAGEEVPQLRLVFHDGQAWQTRQVGQRTLPFRLGGHGTRANPLSRPQIAVGNIARDESETTWPNIYVMFRDAERGDRVSVAISNDEKLSEWKVRDLSSFPVGRWEPGYDRALWRERGRLDLYVQHTSQISGDVVAPSDAPAGQASVLSWTPPYPE